MGRAGGRPEEPGPEPAAGAGRPGAGAGAAGAGAAAFAGGAWAGAAQPIAATRVRTISQLPERCMPNLALMRLLL